jgi:hypothetical protein
MDTNFGNLSDPAVIAAARMALDAAEQRARTEAAEAKRRAEVEAQQAADAEFKAEIDGLLGSWEPVEAAQAALQDLLQRHSNTAAEIKAAEQAVVRARAVLPALVDHAVDGGLGVAVDVAQAYADTAAAEQYVAFLAVVIARFPPLVAEAKKAVKAAIAEAHQPIYERGVDLRIQAAVAADAARGIIPGFNNDGPVDHEALEAARPVFEHANKLLNYAAQHGVMIPAADGITTGFPARLWIERKRWRRPAPGGAA